MPIDDLTALPPASNPLNSPLPPATESWWRRLRDWSSQKWAAIRPGREARRGAVWGTLAAAAVCVIVGGLYLQTGFGYIFDFAFCILFAAVFIPLVALLVVLLLSIFRKLPRYATGVIVGSCMVVMMLWGPPQLGVFMAILIGLATGMLGATIATFFWGNFGQAALSKKIIVALLFLLALAGNIYFVWLFAHAGSMDKLITWKPPADSMPAKLAAPDPSAMGPFHVLKLFYGVGNDIRRPEYGSSVAIKTRTVDSSDFFKDFEGWKRWSRKKYWGFDVDKLPLNARVWYPDGPGPFPLALIVHGNHNMADFSDPGYAYLGELLASRGIILASIDENFLNGGLFHDPPKQQAVRGWMLLEHLKLWREWNQTEGNPFHGRVDMSRIALMGHSRGGEAAATAAAFNHMKYAPEDANIKFDYGFSIRAVVAIAPADGQYKPAGQPRWIEDVSYLTLQGAHDMDVSSFDGSRQWDHVRYTQHGPWFKAEIYAYRANHGQFNTSWGRDDAGKPLGWLLNLKPLMPGDEQRRISKTYISAFLEATLKDRHEYIPLFEDWRVARAWLPDTIYFNRYQDASYVSLAAFDEDADLTTTSAPGGHIEGENLSIWNEAPIPWRNGDRGYNGVFLGWNRAKDAPAASYVITLPAGAAANWHLGPSSILELSVAPLDEDVSLPGKKKDEDKDKKKAEEKKKKEDKSKKKERESPDFTVELVTTDGVTASAPVSRFVSIPPPFKEKFTKLGVLDDAGYNQDWEAVFQSVRAPLSAFETPCEGKCKPFDPAKLIIVRLKFDRTPIYKICISAIGFGKQ
jgi:dienelactone hydrolase